MWKWFITLLAVCAVTPAYAQISSPFVPNGEARIAAMETANTAYTRASAVQYSVPTTGQTVVSDGSGAMFLNPAGLLATLTVTLPSSPVDGQTFEISSSQTITVLTVNGGTVKGGITTILLNGWARWRYSVTAASWFRAS